MSDRETDHQLRQALSLIVKHEFGMGGYFMAESFAEIYTQIRCLSTNILRAYSLCENALVTTSVSSILLL